MRTTQLNFIKIIYILLICFAVIWLISHYAGPVCNLSEYDNQEMNEKLALQQKNLREFEQELGRYEAVMKHKLQRLVEENSPPPWIYAITPTHTRPQQKADLTRLSQTLMHLQNFHWIVVEDSPVQTELVTNFLHRTKLNYTHLFVPTPSESQLKPGDPHWSKFRGVLQRNVGLRWLRKNEVTLHKPSVLYFMDDDNTYDLGIFKEMRVTRGVSVWPVGLVSKLRYERPICAHGKVTGWFTYWKPERAFVVDMAGFAVNTRLLLTYYQAEFSSASRVGYLETDFLSLITTVAQLEPLLNCTRVLVWHTRTETPDLSDEVKMLRRYGHGSDGAIEV